MKPNWLRWLDLPGGQWVGLFTATVISLSIYVTYAGKDLPGGVVAAYAAALTGLTVHSVSKVLKGGAAERPDVQPMGFGLSPERDGD